jgi:hypothetical protein
MSFTFERIGARTFKIVEADRFGQFPFIYVVLGDDKVCTLNARRGRDGWPCALNWSDYHHV